MVLNYHLIWSTILHFLNSHNILIAIVEIKDFMYHNGDSLKEAYKKFSNQSEYAPVIKGQLKGWAAN